MFYQIDEVVKSMEIFREAFEKMCEGLKELADSLEEAFSKTDWFEPVFKYPFIRKLGSTYYCKNMCRKPIRRARSCC